VHAQSASELDRLLQGDYSPRYMMEGNNLDKALTLATQMAEARLTIPKHLVGNVGDCLAIVTQAMLWNMNPFAVAQKTHIVNGTLGYEAQLVNAVVQNSGAVRGAPVYEYRGEGNSLECRVGFVLRRQAKVTFGEWLSINAPTTKNSPLWKTNPKQQLGYLQIKNWARAYCPGAILGVYTVDELADGLADAAVDAAATPSPAPAPRAAELPFYAMADFEKNLPAWTKLVADGKKTAQALLATLSTKAQFTEEQKAAVLSLKPRPADPPLPPAGAHDDFVADMEAAEGVQQ
jgi:hypothetical protein